MKVKRVELGPDDPLFTGGPQTFRPAPRPDRVPQDILDEMHRRASEGMLRQAEDRGEDDPEANE